MMTTNDIIQTEVTEPTWEERIALIREKLRRRNEFDAECLQLTIEMALKLGIKPDSYPLIFGE